MKMKRPHSPFLVLFVMLSLVAAVPASAFPGSTILIEEVVDLPSGSSPGGILPDLEGAIWITGLDSGVVYRVDELLAIEPVLLGTDSQPFDLLTGSDKNVWVSDPNSGTLHQIDRVDKTVLQSYGASIDGYDPTQLTLHRNQSIWFTNFEGHSLGILNRDGSLESIDLVDGAYPLGITTDEDGEIWFTVWGKKQIGKVSFPEKEVQLFDLPIDSGRPTEMIRDQFGGLWFIYDTDKKITHIDATDASMTSQMIPATSSALMDIAIGADGKLWYLGTNGVGSCQISHSELENCQETAFSSPVFEGEGRSSMVSGGDGFLYFTRLDQDKLYRAQTAATDLRDLQIRFARMTEYVLYGGAFSAWVEITNWSTQDTLGTQLMINLDEEIYFDSITGLPKEDCSQTENQVICNVGTIPAQTAFVFEVNFSTEQQGLSGVEKELLFEVNFPALDYLPTNNQIERFFPVLSMFEYKNDFSETAEQELWSFTDIVKPDSSLSYLGHFDNDNVYVNFENLPKHDEVKTCFQLYVNGLWDGEQFIDPDDAENVVGPDIWAYYMDENAVLVTTFSNQERFKQNYPDAYRTEIHPAQTGAAMIGDFDGDGDANDSRYHFCYSMPHDGEALKLTFYGVNLERLEGEFWGIDDVWVQIYYHNAFNWTYLPLMMQ